MTILRIRATPPPAPSHSGKTEVRHLTRPLEPVRQPALSNYAGGQRRPAWNAPANRSGGRLCPLAPGTFHRIQVKWETLAPPRPIHPWPFHPPPSSRVGPRDLSFSCNSLPGENTLPTPPSPAKPRDLLAIRHPVRSGGTSSPQRVSPLNPPTWHTPKSEKKCVDQIPQFGGGTRAVPSAAIDSPARISLDRLSTRANSSNSCPNSSNSCPPAIISTTCSRVTSCFRKVP